MGNNLSKSKSTFTASTKVNSCWVRAANGKLINISFSVRCGSEGELKEHLKENRALIQEADCSCSHCLCFFFYTVVKAFKAVV
jgi:hypothetical protein